MFQQALQSRGLPPAAVASYHGLLTGQEFLENLPQRAMIRVDSPGENFAVEKLLLAAGADAAEHEGSPFLPAKLTATLSEDRGRVLYPRQWYLGYIALCAKWFESITANSQATLTTSADNLRIQFDKRLCHDVCQQAGVPVPQALGSASGWEELMERIQASGLERVFVKLAHGSSASGVVALHVRGDSLAAITSVELVHSDGELKLYNSLKVRRYTSLDDVRDLINALAPHGIHVERWYPKAAVGRRVFDIRVVVVHGEPQQMVVRTSRSPLTNLHLGNRRGDLNEVLARMPGSLMAALHETCQRCAAQFADSLQLGLDVLFTPGFRHHYLLEVNAFGDLLPGVLHHGCDTYQSQIDAVLQAS